MIRRTVAAAGAMAGEGMSEVMDANVGKASGVPNPLPCRLQIDDMTRALAARQQVGIAVNGRDGFDNLQRSRPDMDDLRTGLAVRKP